MTRSRDGPVFGIIAILVMAFVAIISAPAIAGLKTGGAPALISATSQTVAPAVALKGKDLLHPIAATTADESPLFEKRVQKKPRETIPAESEAALSFVGGSKRAGGCFRLLLSSLGEASRVASAMKEVSPAMGGT